MRPPGRPEDETAVDVVMIGPAEKDPVEREPSRGDRHHRRRTTVIVAAVVLALVVTAVVAYRLGSTEPQAARPAPSPSKSAAAPLTTAQVYEALAPSVVLIESLSGNRVTSTGTGVVANAEGVVLTALHVVNGGGAIRLTFADGTRSAATVVGSDPKIDIAALAAETLPTVVVPAVIGNSGRLAIGDNVVAIGNQLGLVGSATAGVVSGLDRGASGSDGVDLAGLIQFDAAVNPGSSGGPLVNMRGETIGIVVALANPTDAGTFIGVGFAVPIGAALGGSGAGPGQGPQQ